MLLTDALPEQGHLVPYTTSHHALQVANLRIRRHATHEVCLRSGVCRWSLNLARGFVWVHMGSHIYFITPEDHVTVNFSEVQGNNYLFLYMQLIIHLF